MTVENRASLSRRRQICIEIVERIGRYDPPVRKFTFEIPDPAHPYPDYDGGPRPSAPLIGFVPESLDPARVSGRVIEEWTPYAGTYGMGGPGFLGFRLEPEEWLIVAIWGASDWFRLDCRPLGDSFWERHGRGRPWLDDPDVDRNTLFRGWHITSVQVNRDSITLEFDGRHTLHLAPGSDDRPVHEGNGSPREIEVEDDLRTAVFLAPTVELWV